MFFPGLVLLGIATVFRTTGVFMSAIFGIPILQKVLRNILKKNPEKAIKTVLSGILVLTFFFTYIVKYLYEGYLQFCTRGGVSPEFCQWKIPNIYSYIQDKFWQVGFLVYYQPDKLAPMLFGLPSIFIAVMTLSSTTNHGLNLSYWLLLFVTIFFSNVHSSARFFSSHPLYYLSLSKFLLIKERFSFCQLVTLFYLVVYNIFGVVFFPQRFWWV